MNLIHHLPVLLIILPLSASLLSPILSKLWKQLGRILVIASLAASFLCAIGLLCQVLSASSGQIHYYMGNWEPPLGIEFVIDPLNALLVLFITFIALCTSVYCGNLLQN